ncbi:SRPBCC domain-containing protein [Flavivirga aquimarina]|uniref:SRPBCC domain-containing protein n=1 Tax=Flavivirga aquimarina TaxID=2027862 RepID=A0ABT8WBS1_9FLAO|nr:SRPBCC domain-containing protein [Flavivirga aquimarina]MDO5970592.1 SRPBCC domain-containing protein [Flavivirga aquimarina]
MNKANKMGNKTITIKRTFNAPLSLVWEAWTQSEHIAEWWSPKGVKTKVVEHDFKVGGKWKYIMPMPNGQEFIAEGEYTEIVEFEKIISSANFKPMTEGVEIQSLFKPNGNKTDFTFNVVHPTEEYKIQQEKMGIMNGWSSVFVRLDELLKNM